MIVIHRGTLVHQECKTVLLFDRHNWFYSGRVISSAMIGFLEEDGKIDVSLPVSAYLPELKGSVWDSVPVQDALHMATALESTEHDEPRGDARTNLERGWFQWAASLGAYPDVK
jgi:CubicO group peptidase (beta-lactamase class C family)